MRGRPMKEDKSATQNDSLRRARGRAAQRRYRYRKEQTLAETQARNEKLEAVMDGMVKALLRFGDHVMESKAGISHGDLSSAYCELTRTFLDLTAKVNEEEDGSHDPSLNFEHEDKTHTKGPKNPQLSVDSPADTESSSCGSSESASAKHLPDAEKKRHKPFGLHPTMRQDAKVVSPGIILMPTQNPLLSGDYATVDELSFPEPSLWKRLLRHGLLRSYRALDSLTDHQADPKSWLARSHHFSLRHTTRWHLMFLTKLALERMIHDTRTPSHGPRPPQIDWNELFSTTRHRDLAHAVLNDLEREGVWPEMLRSEEIEDYISTKGRFSLVGDRLELRLFSPKKSRTPSLTRSTSAEAQVVILDTEKLIRRICDESICLGDGMGFPKRIINNAIVYSAVHMAANLLQMIPYGAGINSAMAIGKDLGVDEYRSGWLVASYPLTQGAFVLLGGRIGMIFGHKNTVIVAGVWWGIFTLASGFAKNFVALTVLRALTGVGGGMIVPNSIALLTITFPPGRMRNITVALFGAMAPIGSAVGAILPGLLVQLAHWKWLFFFMAMFGAAVFVLFYFVVPSEGEPFDKHGSFDYPGAYLATAGLVLFNFVWNQAPAVGWNEPYEYSLLIVSILHLAGFLIWEGRYAKQPILPFDIWKAPSFLPMITATFLTFMAVGIYCWYLTLWNSKIRGYDLLLVGAAWQPLTVFGTIAAFTSGKIVRYIPAEYIMALGALGTAVSLTLIATQPIPQSYWAQCFPSFIAFSFGPDFIFTAAQIITSNAVKRKHQGIAGSLVGTVGSYGLSTGLGFAATVEAYTNDGGRDMAQGYRNACYLGIGIAGAAVLLSLAFVRIPKDQRDGWDEDDGPEMERQVQVQVEDKRLS
ncbi:hypothetical protein H2200_000216 [Cladophialophora chaetospira]|uniref:Major facilitator superfamily (MFS) profile domain-containing protein n=1 Tax=Cladophialophora chaetospira TaxID=386627 RepID=A0AA39CQ44_9EURO|nr:hypothetical protein H2200_000216 [Cladophialophora chaetospira]